MVQPWPVFLLPNARKGYLIRDASTVPEGSWVFPLLYPLKVLICVASVFTRIPGGPLLRYRNKHALSGFFYLPFYRSRVSGFRSDSPPREQMHSSISYNRNSKSSLQFHGSFNYTLQTRTLSSDYVNTACAFPFMFALVCSDCQTGTSQDSSQQSD